MCGSRAQHVFQELAAGLTYKTVIEIGSRDVNGTVRQFLKPCEYTGIDLWAGPNVDIVANALIWRPKSRVDLVICLSVLEHSDNAPGVVTAAHRMLAKGGHVIIEAASTMKGHRCYDGVKARKLYKTEWYRNLCGQELQGYMEIAGFAEIRIRMESRSVWGLGEAR